MRKVLISIDPIRLILSSVCKSDDWENYIELAVGYDCVPGEARDDDVSRVSGMTHKGLVLII